MSARPLGHRKVSNILLQIWKLRFCHKANPLFRLWARGLVKISKLIFSRDTDCLIEILKLKFYHQYLCIIVWFELNPRVRYACGNVFILITNPSFLLIVFLSLLKVSAGYNIMRCSQPRLCQFIVLYIFIYNLSKISFDLFSFYWRLQHYAMFPAPASSDTSLPPHSFQERIHLSDKNLNPLNHSSRF